MYTSNFKRQAHALVDSLAENATWLDLMNRAAERQDLQDNAAESETDHVPEDVLAEYDAMAAERDREGDRAI
jgi:hypothetical protein